MQYTVQPNLSPANLITKTIRRHGHFEYRGMPHKPTHLQSTKLDMIETTSAIRFFQFDGQFAMG